VDFVLEKDKSGREGGMITGRGASLRDGKK